MKILDASGRRTELNVAAWLPGLLGDGSDGNVTFDGSLTVLGLTPVSGAYTLTRSIYLSGCTNNATINTAGFKIYCTGLFTNNGTIANTGKYGSVGGATGSAGGGATGVTGADVGAGGAGGGSTGGTGAAGNAPPSGVFPAGGVGGAGGAGGAAGSNNGGAAGAGGAIPSPHVPRFLDLHLLAGASLITGGASGGGGGGGRRSRRANRGRRRRRRLRWWCHRHLRRELQQF